MRLRLVSVAFLAGALYGCSPDNSALVRPSSDAAALRASSGSEEQAILLAKGLALAFADASLRLQVLEDLRDSPFREHSIHLASYLQGTRGGPLAQAAARALDMPVEEFIGITRALPGLALLLPVRFDRTSWTGSSNIVVTATTLPKSRWDPLLVLPGYDIAGTSVKVPVQEGVGPVLIMVYPAQYPFGPNPEERRAAAPKQDRRTISTPEEEIGPMFLEPCDGTNCGGGDGTAGGSGYNLGSDCNSSGIYQVTSSNDLDRDGLKDECEYRLAYAFRPALVFHHDENCPTRESYWTVHKPLNSRVHIAYLLSYWEDCGFGAHHGDSEWLIVKVGTPKTNYWNTHSIITSAHWHATFGDRTQENPFDQLEWADSAGGRAYIYVSQNKHANYENEARCDDGSIDECTSLKSWNVKDVEVLSNRNIGRASYPFDIDPNLFGYPPDCTKSKIDPVNRYAIECYLQGDATVNEFGGWSPFRSGVGKHYREPLKYYGLFD